MECTLFYFLALGLHTVHHGVEASDGVWGGSLVFSNDTYHIPSVLTRRRRGRKYRHVPDFAVMQKVSCRNLSCRSLLFLPMST